MHSPNKQTTLVLLTLILGSSFISLPALTVAQTSTTAITSSQTTKTPNTDILWNTNVSWNYTGSPAENISIVDIDRVARDWTTPVIADGAMYAGATTTVFQKGNYYLGLTWVNVFAFNTSNGQLIWRYQANSDEISGFTVANGRVFFGVKSNYYGAQDTLSGLYALDATNGTILWKTRCTIFYTTIVTENGTVLLNSGHSLLALNQANGTIIWNYTTNDIVIIAPAVANGILYAPSYDHTLYALNKTTGQKVWAISTDKGYRGFLGVCISGNTIYTSNEDGDIYALNAATGAQLWTKNTAPPEFTWTNLTAWNPAIYYNGVLYFSSQSDQHIHITTHGRTDYCSINDRFSLFALDAGTGQKIWNHTSVTDELGSPASIVDGVIYAASGASVLGYNRYNGDLVWNYTHGNEWPQTQPVAFNGDLYIGYGNDQIYAVKLPVLDIQTQISLQVDALSFESIGPIIFGVIVLMGLTFFVFWIQRKRSKPNKSTN
jgi:eukaryotic-like serine/threonine-protein kinase